jgi:hypothetical protein
MTISQAANAVANGSCPRGKEDVAKENGLSDAKFRHLWVCTLSDHFQIQELQNLRR